MSADGVGTLRAALEKGNLFDSVLVDEIPEISNEDFHRDGADVVRYLYDNRD